MDIVSLLILRALSDGGGTPVATDVSYDNTTSGLLADNVQSAIDELSSEKINTSEKGTANGVAELNENGIVLTSQLPSYVDDVLEYNTYSDFPQEGESGKIYVDLSTNKTYRWGGSGYVEISPSLALGETSSTAYRGDRGKTAYDHSQLTTGNPHNVTKAQVGLGNVDNTSDLNKPISTATQTALNTKTSVADVEEMIEETFEDKTVTGNPISFETVVGTETTKSCEVTFSPKQSGSGDPSPTNIRPISGWDSLVLNQCGKNLLDISTVVAGGLDTDTGEEVVSTSTKRTGWVRVKPDTDYVISGISNLRIYYYQADKTYIERGGIITSFTTPANCGYVRFQNTNSVWNSANDVQIEEGTTATSYEAYQGQTHTATFSETIYGGTWKATEGKAVIDKVYYEYDGDETESWEKTTASGNPVVRIVKPSGIKNNNTAFTISNMLTRTVTSTAILEGLFYIGGSNLVIGYNDTLENWKSLIGTTHLQFVFELETPQEITLTPETIELLKGNNVLWTDGDNITLKYSADIPSYVEKAIEDAKELPSVTSTDEGKVLTVDSNGEWVASTLPDGTNISY